jgi:sialidase-1
LALTSLACRSFAESASQWPQQIDVFVGGQGGYNTYRIPSILVTTKGTLLAFAEGRRAGKGDSGDIDLLLRRSPDNGRTWQPTQVVWNDGPNTCGNPCPVVDRTTGTIWLWMTHNLGTDREDAIIARTSRGTRTVWLSKSTNDGATWSPPVEMTRDIKHPDWTWYATGPGAGIQLKSGRLVIPCDHICDGKPGGVFFSHILYSADGGATWKLGGTAGPGVNECEVVQLTDGSLLLNMRNDGREEHRTRAISRSSDGGLTWSPIKHDAPLVEPICQASIRRWPSEAGATNGRILFSNPATSTARKEMTVRLSEDDGQTWPWRRRLWAGPSAYSSLAIASDGIVLCLYERGERTPYEKITLARLPGAWLTEPEAKGTR